eukprot:4005235-Pyramimonas_sp.AAC.1
MGLDDLRKKRRPLGKTSHTARAKQVLKTEGGPDGGQERRRAIPQGLQAGGGPRRGRGRQLTYRAELPPQDGM